MAAMAIQSNRGNGLQDVFPYGLAIFPVVSGDRADCLPFCVVGLSDIIDLGHCEHPPVPPLLDLSRTKRYEVSVMLAMTFPISRDYPVSRGAILRFHYCPFLVCNKH